VRGPKIPFNKKESLVFLPAIAIVCAGVEATGGSGLRDKDVSIEQILQAIRLVETGSHPAAGRNAVGDQGRSLGPFQIQRGYWKDSGVSGRYEDVRDTHYAKRVILAYWRKYCPVALAKHDWRTLARVHNGGPGGANKKATLGYAELVKRRLLGSNR